MISRHIPTRRLKSAVLFSAPGKAERAPDDEVIPRLETHKRKNILKRSPGGPSTETGEAIHISSASMLGNPSQFPVFARNFHLSGLDQSTTSTQKSNATLCLPVLKVSSTTTVEGTLAHTTLIQSFRNPSTSTIEEARHTFPLYDGAVITSFECIIGDERRLRGVVKPTEQARNEYKRAKQDPAKAAALLEEQTPEIFETSLGNIPSTTTVEVEIVYIQNLKVVMMQGGDAEGIALIIPTSIAPRYTYSQTKPEIPCDGLDINILVLKDGKVNPDGCQEESGHILYDEGTKMLESPQRSDGEHGINEYHSWEHHSDRPILKKDFVFVIQLQKGHRMPSEAIYCPPDDSGLAAMMVNIRPNDLFRDAIIPQSFSGEILFLLDQSGSMSGRKIDVLRRAMHLVLTGIPRTCSFNIVSWGSETWALWGQSRSHSSENIKNAKAYIDKITSTMGGTDLLRALKSAVERRSKSSESTQIVVLTDGELDPKEPAEFVWRTRQELQTKIRFFALGIGGCVPNGLIENIAELGGGFGEIINPTQMPRWEGKLNGLVRSALGVDTWDVDIDLGDGYERCGLTDYSLSNSSNTQRAPYFQAPQTVSGLPPFRFTSIFFLIDVKDRGSLPREVTIVTTTHGAKRKTYKLPVNQMRGQDGTMHQLAAKAALMDLEGLIKKEPLCSRLIEENANIIGTRYSVTSKWTSFIAVSLDELNDTGEGGMVEHYRAMFDGVEINELLATADPGGDESSDGSDDSGSICRTSFRRMSRLSVSDSPRPFAHDPEAAPLPIAGSYRESFDILCVACGEDGRLGGDEAVGTLEAAPVKPRWSFRDPRRARRPMRSPYPGRPFQGPMKQGNSASKRILGYAEAPDPKPLIIHDECEDSDTRLAFSDSPSSTIPFSYSTFSHSQHSPHPGTENLFKRLWSKLSPKTVHKSERQKSKHSLSEGRIREEAEGTVASPSLDTLHGIDPLLWETAVAYTNDQGLFHLPHPARKLLHIHFCPNTATLLDKRLRELLDGRGLKRALYAKIIDTLMMVKCYRTHLAVDEEVWDLMMERAEDAVSDTIGRNALKSLEELLIGSMMHEHYQATTGVSEVHYEGSNGTTTCPICKVPWQSSRAFLCPFDHDPGTSRVFQEWDDFWKHQELHGHMVCPKEDKGT